MRVAEIKGKRNGRSTIKEVSLPALVQLAVVIISKEALWKVGAGSVGMDIEYLRNMPKIILMMMSFLTQNTMRIRSKLSQTHCRDTATAQRSIDVIND